MENTEKKQNLMEVLHNRRVQNFKSQFKSVVLEGFEIFGEAIVTEVWDDCKAILVDYNSKLNE